jgi:segregation and condensation protein A
MAEYKVKFEVFEGPLDLLLYLIKKEEVDIYDVNLTQLATQFIAYIDLMRMLDLEVAGEFLVMASTLMFIKSKELLPLDQQVQTDAEEDEEDPRWELIRQLVEYKKFKDAAAQLKELETLQDDVFPRIPGKPEFKDETPLKPDVGIFDLLNAVNSILKRISEQPGTREIFEEKWSVSEKIEVVLKTMMTIPRIKFSDLFVGAMHRGEVVVTFLALLELIRLKQVVVEQTEVFSEIEIVRTAPREVSSEVQGDPAQSVTTLAGAAETLNEPPQQEPPASTP